MISSGYLFVKIFGCVKNLLGRFNQTSPLHELFGHLPVMMVDEEAVFLVQQGYGRHVIRIQLEVEIVFPFYQRPPRYDACACFLHVFPCFQLLVEDMGLHLVHHRCYFHIGGKVNQMVGIEVAYADGTLLARFIGFLQVAVSAVAVTERLMKQHQVDVVGLQFRRLSSMLFIVCSSP